MSKLRLLPWDDGVRNIFRRSARTALTLSGLTMVILLNFIVVAFNRGVESPPTASGGFLAGWLSFESRHLRPFDDPQARQALIDNSLWHVG